MNTEMEFLNSANAAAANANLVRDVRDVPKETLSPVSEEKLEAEREHSRRVAAHLRQIDRENWLRQNRWAAFQKAICNLQLSPEEVSARVEQFFAPTPEVEEEEAPPAPAEEAHEEIPTGL